MRNKWQIILFLILLSYTNVYIFKIGSAPFTLFYLFSFFYFFKYFLLKKEVKVPKYYFLFFVYIFIINLFNYEIIKWSSFGYTIIILAELFLIFNILRLLDFKKIIMIFKIIILTYFINIFITTILIFYSSSLLDQLKEFLQFYDFAGKVRPQGFSSEPSYAAIIISFTLLAFLFYTDFKFNVKFFKWHAMGILSIILVRSSYGLIFLFLIIIYWAYILKLYKKLYAWPIFFILIIFIYINIDLDSFDRILKLISSILNSDNLLLTLRTISDEDSSASFRITPTLVLLDFWSENSGNILFGFGAGQANVFFSQYYNNLFDLEEINLGFIPSFLYNYGIFGVLLFILFIKNIMPNKLIVKLLFFLFLFNADLNTQIFVFIFFIMYIIKIKNYIKNE